MKSPLLLCLLALSPLQAEDMVAAAVSFHTAAPLGVLIRDVNGHPGFGVGLHAVLGFGNRHAFRPQFVWTGYRVNDYNLGTRMVASIADANYREDRLVFRTYALGVDYLLFSENGTYAGPYLVFGAGMVRSALHWEDRYVPADGGPEQVETVATGARHDGAFGQAGIGWQGLSGAFAELRISTVPYAGTPGQPITSLFGDSPTGTRQGGAIHFSVGARF